eukprot:Skav223295  [mRNA]  locus=scaffold2998:138903:139550:+ [translate_table: standard]
MCDATFVRAMAGSEQKLVSCLGFARRLAKRMQLFDVQSHLDQALLHLTRIEDRTPLQPQITRRFPIFLSDLIPDEQLAKVAETGTQTTERMVTETEVAGFLETVEDRVATLLEQRFQPLDSMNAALEAKMLEQARQGELINQLQASIHQLTEQLPVPQCAKEATHDFEDGRGSPEETVGQTCSFLTRIDISHLRCTHRLLRFQCAPVSIDCSNRI